MKKLFFALSAWLTIQTTYGQSLIYESYNWDTKPIQHAVPEGWKEKNEVVVKDFNVREYAHDNTGEFVMFTIEHTIIHLNTSEAVDDNNKLYLPVASESSIIVQKARVIKPNGKIKELDQSDIQEAKDEESGYTYKYFALEGLEVGDEIEYIYHLKKSPSYFGTIVRPQGSTPKLNYHYEIVCPSHLLFSYKGYNGFPGMELDSSTHEDQNILSVTIDSLPHLVEETGALYRANCMQFVFKLEENIGTRTKNIINYTNVSKAIYSNLLGEGVSKKEKKAAAKMVKKLKIDESLSELEKIKLVEDHIKRNVLVLDFQVPDWSDISKIVKDNIANDQGITKLFANAFKEMGIETEMVYTCDRMDYKFDPEFEAYSFLDQYLIYFPSLDLYMDPTDRYSVVGLVDWNYNNNYGLFISSLNMSGMESGVGEIRFIPYPDQSTSVSKMSISTDFGDGLEEPTFKLHTEETGYYAWAQPYYTLRDDEWIEETNEQQVKSITENLEIKEVEASNIEWSDRGDKPYVIDATFTSNEFVEKAADKYLFKVGELIGPQMDLYQEDEKRTLPVEESYCRTYDREITFSIPEGYTCDNLDDLKSNVVFIKDGKEIMAFKSSYTRKGDVVTVTITEFYTTLEVPVSEYAEYKKVINAAADFNKVTMVFEPAG